ncbi:hypothetical protein OHB26_30620 [Nocardia sp. NBC_01503]|uniref:hypothetical protein n=1 Tax=Nocardia sp. NBC_01503 TaxID=2975997 RepID=UPI002E7BA43E|nr:hypothetical protein [Nocardia sp. NBC_01503]WTL31233.1 hypothetical protein OHB26_30620 [Nocardia sp. NBC_01503]
MSNRIERTAPGDRPRRRTGRVQVTGTVGAAAAMLFATVLVAPTVHAAGTVTSLNASPGSPAQSVGLTSQYGSNCTYTLTAAVGDYHNVRFTDTGAATFAPNATVIPYYDSHTSRGQATVSWTPTAPGQHHLYAEQYPNGSLAIDLLVGTGVNTGSACLVLP